MFDGIQHIGYLVDDLDEAVAWFQKAFNAVNCGGTTMQKGRIVPSGGRNAFIQFGNVEVELMQPGDLSALPKKTLVMHHVGYVVSDIGKAADEVKARGLKFLADAPYTNPMGQRVHYFDPDTTNGMMIHLTQVPDRAKRSSDGPWIEKIIHPGYLVPDAEAAAAWYVDKLGGVRIGGGRSRRGGRVAFVNCGSAQIELIEPQDTDGMGTDHVLDHVGYVTKAIEADIAAYQSKGLKFADTSPVINPIGQKLIYFDPATTMGTRMHLTELPA